MEHQSPVPTNGSPAALTPSQQPTYTTAGTIYNPSASQPLQPPTRRGRSSRLPTGNVSSELSIYPRANLTTVSGRASTSNLSARSTSSLRQYTPLQQNYHRAVSPFAETSHVAINMALRAPCMRSGNTPAPVLGSQIDQNDKGKGKESVKEDGSSNKEHGGGDGGDDDDEANDVDGTDGSDDGENNNNYFHTDLLKMMTVKSLHNLASYPNPNQKRAQEAILRGAKPLLSVREVLKAASMKDYNLCETGSHSPLQEVHEKDAPPRPAPAAHVSANGSDIEPLLPTGPGAPRPLTAGPPGQRQYRSSTFESTIRALNTHNVAEDDSQDSQDSCTRKTNGFPKKMMLENHVQIHRLDNEGLISWAANTVPAFTEPSSLARLVVNSEPEFDSVRLSRYRLDLVGTLISGSSALDVTNLNWQDPSPASRARYVPEAWHWSETAIKKRSEYIDSMWYAGSGLLDKTLDETMEDSRERRTHSRFGAVGDGRPATTKVEYERMTVEQAKKVPVHEYMAPILNMALDTIVRIGDDRFIYEDVQLARAAQGQHVHGDAANSTFGHFG